MFNILNTRILLSGATIVPAAALIIGATYAFFSDTETSSGNVLTAGAVDLLIDNESYYNGVLNEDTTWTLSDLTDQLFFDFSDVKPNDLGEDTISFHADNDYWLCAEMTLTNNDDNTCTANEQVDDLTCSEPDADLFDGELAQNINFIFWGDDGDNVLEDDELVFEEGTAEEVLDDNAIALADSATNNIGGLTGEPAPGGETVYVGKAWCFGTLTQGSLTQDNLGADSPRTPANSTGGVSCDGSLLDNSTQTDSVLADIKFTAVQSRNNAGFICGQEPTPTFTPTPTPPTISCEIADNIFASDFSNNIQGLRKDGTAVLANRSVPSSAFGAPQSTGIPVDPAVPLGSFFSLGFAHANNANTHGSIVLEFAETFFNGPGDDLQVFEVTGATTPAYPDEAVMVEVGSTSAGPW